MIQTARDRPADRATQTRAQRATPALSAIVVHWRNEAQLERLLAAWPSDPRIELLVVDNSGTAKALPAGVRRLVPAGNLGFGGGVSFALTRARASRLLILNPDARPEAGAIDRLLAAFDDFPDAAGIVPALIDPSGRSQHRWQLRPLPAPWQLVVQALRLVAIHGPRQPPPRGTEIAQPAAAALGLRRAALEAVGGFDPAFFPAWFEDVDLARRFAEAGLTLRYAPAARFVHEGGTSVPALGFRSFLWLYHRHLGRYLRRHHGRLWAAAARALLVAAMALRVLALPLRRPRQAASRRAAAAALAATAWGALSGWRRPRDLYQAFRAPGERPTHV